jgi:hypothetical protein
MVAATPCSCVHHGNVRVNRRAPGSPFELSRRSSSRLMRSISALHSSATRSMPPARLATSRLSGGSPFSSITRGVTAFTNALLAEQLVILGMCSDPEPNKDAGYLCCQCAVMAAYAC